MTQEEQIEMIRTTVVSDLQHYPIANTHVALPCFEFHFCK